MNCADREVHLSLPRIARTSSGRARLNFQTAEIDRPLPVHRVSCDMKGTYPRV